MAESTTNIRWLNMCILTTNTSDELIEAIDSAIKKGLRESRTQIVNEALIEWLKKNDMKIMFCPKCYSTKVEPSSNLTYFDYHCKKCGANFNAETNQI